MEKRYRLVVPESELRRAVRQLEGKWSEGLVRLGVRLSWHAEGLDLFVAEHGAAPPETEPMLVLWQWDTTDEPLPTRIAALLENEVCPLLVGVGIGADTAYGQVVGVVRFAPRSRLLPLDELVVSGANGTLTERLTEKHLPFYLERNADGARSRVIGALGAHLARELAGQHVAVVGCGGLGSVLSNQLARLQGAQGRLTLVDPDTLERANLGAWLNTEENLLGENKAEALRAVLERGDAPEITVCPHPVESDRGRAAVKCAAMLVCTADRAEARWWCGFYAALYRKPLLVIEVGTFLGSGPDDHQARMRSIITPLIRLPMELLEESPRAWLADIRLVLPGRTAGGGCLLCAGGIGSLQRNSGPFWRERAGTLPHGNAEVVGRALRLWLAYLRGEVTRTTHLRLDDRADPLADWYRVESKPSPSCPLCRLLGHGDTALDRGAALLEEWSTKTGNLNA